MTNTKQIAKTILGNAENKNPLEWTMSRSSMNLYVTTDLFTAIEFGSYMSKAAHDPINDTINYIEALIENLDEMDEENRVNNAITMLNWDDWVKIIFDELDEFGHFDYHDDGREAGIVEYYQSAGIRGKLRNHLYSTMFDAAIEFGKQTKDMNEQEKQEVISHLKHNVINYVRNYFYDADVENKINPDGGVVEDRIDWKQFA